jgi:hypothetical protein
VLDPRDEEAARSCETAHPARGGGREGGARQLVRHCAVWKPQDVLFVNERTLLPVFVPLAPAATLMSRFPDVLGVVLDAHGVDPEFVSSERAAMTVARYAKTSNRGVLGMMNELASLADPHRTVGNAGVYNMGAGVISRGPRGPAAGSLWP